MSRSSPSTSSIEDTTLMRSGDLAEGALDLFVLGVADEYEVVVLLSEATRLGVDLGDEGAGRVDDAKAIRLPPLGGEPPATPRGRRARRRRRRGLR